MWWSYECAFFLGSVSIIANTYPWFYFFSFICFWANQRSIYHNFFPLLPLTEVSPRPSDIPGGNPPGDGQSAVGWGDAGFEPGTAAQQSGALPLSHHASQLSHHFINRLLISDKYNLLLYNFICYMLSTQWIFKWTMVKGTVSWDFYLFFFITRPNLGLDSYP